MSGDCAHCLNLDSSVGHCTCDETRVRAIKYNPCLSLPCKAKCSSFDTCIGSKRCKNCDYYAPWKNKHGYCAYHGNSAPMVSENHGRDCERFTYLYKEEEDGKA